MQKGSAGSSPIYDISMPTTESLPAAAWCKPIQDDRRVWQNQLGMDGVYIKDIWKEFQSIYPYTEHTMISDNQRWTDSGFYAADIAGKPLFCIKWHSCLFCAMGATSDLRVTLRCANPNLAAYKGNSLMKSRYSESGFNNPVFQISSFEATLFGMRIAELGAYLLNYHHDGAPQIWTVVEPAAHKKLEDTLCSSQQILKAREEASGLAIPRPKIRPACDNFLRHQPMYVPNDTLALYSIEYTRAVQYLGEMIIVFPFAYHQAYNAGPNVTESMPYASSRWEVFPNTNLLQPCHKDCKRDESLREGPSSSDSGFVKSPASKQGMTANDSIGHDTPSLAPSLAPSSDSSPPDPSVPGPSPHAEEPRVKIRRLI